jgi:tetratricopeptide (TPR) repeat protein
MRTKSRPFTLASVAGAFCFLVFAVPPAHATSDPNQGWVEVRTAHFTVATNAGDKEGRRIANQFEQIREMFHTAFAKMRVDPAQPIVILAAKNEATMKLFLPEDWAIKGHLHPAGMYQEGEDKHYVLMRADAEGNNPFHTLYHEYTHALLHLNFSDLPLWLDEGLAEFFGNSTLGSKESYTGTIDRGHLYMLSQSKLLPVETLLQVDHQSPYYNEADRASVFYAESWAVVHYLMLNPDARQKQLLSKFFLALDKSGTQLEAAREAFGDLKAFDKTIEWYARQTNFQVGLVKSKEAEINYSVRPLEPAEALALRADFFSHSHQLALAKPALEQALQLGPNLPFAHEATGYYKYRTDDLPGALAEMQRSIELGAKSFVPFFYRGVLLARGASQSSDANLQAAASLEKAMEMNPQFAPAFEALAEARMESEATRKDAVSPALQAVRLDPSSRQYRLNLANVLIVNNRDAEARIVGQKLLEAARTPEQTSMAQALLKRVDQHEQWLAQMKAATSANAAASGSKAPSGPPTTAPPGASVTAASAGVSAKIPTSMAVDGLISSVDCERSPEITLIMKLSKGPMTFHIADFRRILSSASDEKSLPKLEGCKQWAGRQAKVWFRVVQGQEYLGEISKIHFF